MESPFQKLKTELHQKMDEYEGNWKIKYPENAEFSNIEKFKEYLFSGPKNEPNKNEDWIKETDLYKSFERAGCYIHHSESGGFIVVDPSIVQQCKDF
jgi:hypothetical protein